MHIPQFVVLLVYEDQRYDSRTEIRRLERPKSNLAVFKRHFQATLQRHVIRQKHNALVKFVAWRDKSRQALLRYDTYVHCFMSFIYLAASHALAQQIRDFIALLEALVWPSD